jgi:hypothetical protein
MSTFSILWLLFSLPLAVISAGCSPSQPKKTLF